MSNEEVYLMIILVALFAWMLYDIKTEVRENRRVLYECLHKQNLTIHRMLHNQNPYSCNMCTHVQTRGDCMQVYCTKYNQWTDPLKATEQCIKEGAFNYAENND